jgi:hypothetical protein
MGGNSFEDDPLTAALAPPPNETPEQRAAREQREVAARAVSQAIDEDIAKEKKALAKKRKAVKVLLLGQSESGTFLKHSLRVQLRQILMNATRRRQVDDPQEYVIHIHLASVRTHTWA